MKKILSLLVLAGLIALITIGGTGCATAVRGTWRELDVISSIPNTQFTITHQRGGNSETKVGLVRTFHFTSGNRSPILVKAVTPGGQVGQAVVEWSPKRGWFIAPSGGVMSSILLGVGGLVSGVTDVATGAYSYPKEFEVEFRFDPNMENTRQSVTSTGVPVYQVQQQPQVQTQLVQPPAYGQQTINVNTPVNVVIPQQVVPTAPTHPQVCYPPLPKGWPAPSN